MELGENTQIRANTTFVIKTICVVASAVWYTSVIWIKITTLENDNVGIHPEVGLNSAFRVGWPRGDFGALPDDMEQSMNIQMLKEKIEKLEKDVEKLRYGGE